MVGEGVLLDLSVQANLLLSALLAERYIHLPELSGEVDPEWPYLVHWVDYEAGLKRLGGVFAQIPNLLPPLVLYSENAVNTRLAEVMQAELSGIEVVAL